MFEILVAARRQAAQGALAARLRPISGTDRADLAGVGLCEFVPRASPMLSAPTHLAPLIAELERAQSEQREVCFAVPPRHGKTTLLVHAIVWWLLRDPTTTILFVSYAHSFAAKQGRKAMRLAQRCGVVLGDKRRADEWTTAAGGGLKCAGVDGQITGEGFRIVLVDDPHKNRAEAESRRIREGVVEGFNDNVYTRQDVRGTSFFVVHTRWHEHDLTGELTRTRDDDEAAAPPFRSLVLPAVDANGDALAPTLYPLARLERIRARVGEYAWASLYQGAPRPRGGMLFADPVLFERLPDAGAFRYAIGVDLAHTARTRQDFNAAVLLRLDVSDGAVHVIETIRSQGTLTASTRDGVSDGGFAAQLAGMQARYPTARAVMFTSAKEALMLDLLAGLRASACFVESWPAIRDKWQRAQGYAAGWNAGRVRIPRVSRWTDDFVAEHMAFSGLAGERDDQVDAAAAAWDALDAGAGLYVGTIRRAETADVPTAGRRPRRRVLYS